MSLRIRKKQKNNIMETETTETKKRKRTPKKKEVKVHTAFEQEWHELGEYAGYAPEQYKSWRLLKESFYSSRRYGHDRPLLMNIKKDNKIIVVKLYGFKIPEAPLAVSLGTDATKGRVAFCQLAQTKQKIAIAW